MSMRALLVDPRLTAPGYFFALAEALREQVSEGIDLAFSPPRYPVATCDADLSLFSETVENGRRLGIPGRLINKLCSVLYGRELDRILAFVCQHNHRIVHFNWSFRPALELALVRRLQARGTPVVYTVHNAVPHDCESPSPEMLELCRQVDHVVVLTEHIKLQLIELAGISSDRVSRIPHGSFTEDSMPLVAQPQDACPFPGHPKILCIGNIRPYKGVPDLLNAWPLVLEEVPRARLVVAGKLYLSVWWQMQRAWRRLGKEQQSVHREFGYLRGERYAQLIEASTALVQPYRSASQSGNTVHAYSRGIPVVCTRVGGLAEIVQEGRTGAVAEPGSRFALAAAIVRILRANAQDELAQNCRDLYRGSFRRELIAKAHLDLYKQLIASIH